MKIGTSEWCNSCGVRGTAPITHEAWCPNKDFAFRIDPNIRPNEIIGLPMKPERNVARECELEQRQEMAAKLIRRGKVAQALALLEGRPGT